MESNFDRGRRIKPTLSIVHLTDSNHRTHSAPAKCTVSDNPESKIHNFVLIIHRDNGTDMEGTHCRSSTLTCLKLDESLIAYTKIRRKMNNYNYNFRILHKMWQWNINKIS